MEKKQEKLLILLSYNNVPLSTPPALSEIRNSDRNVIMGQGNVLPLAFPVVIDSRMELLYFLLTILFWIFLYPSVLQQQQCGTFDETSLASKLQSRY